MVDTVAPGAQRTDSEDVHWSKISSLSTIDSSNDVMSDEPFPLGDRMQIPHRPAVFLFGLFVHSWMRTNVRPAPERPTTQKKKNNETARCRSTRRPVDRSPAPRHQLGAVNAERRQRSPTFREASPKHQPLDVTTHQSDFSTNPSKERSFYCITLNLVVDSSDVISPLFFGTFDTRLLHFSVRPL